MLLLTLFAFVAGAGTALSPCVLPVLPALLSAGVTGGRRRPVGIVLGLALTFTITIVGFGEVVDGVGLGDGTVRTLATLALLAFGLAVLLPDVGAQRPDAGDGLRSGIAIGAALGFVYAPCAGPILASVIAVGAASGETVVIGLAYAAGTSTVLLGLALGGRGLVDRVRRRGRGPLIRRAVGTVMVLTAVAMIAELDLRFQTAIADDLPAAVVNPTKVLEESAAVQERLADLQGPPRFDAGTVPARTPPAGGTVALPTLGPAPDFTGTQRWFNTAGGRPLSLPRLTQQRRVVLVDFWTFTCINCIRTLPHLKALDRAYRDRGLTIVGVHSPEFAFEKDAGNVRDAIRRSGLRYPVAQDNDFGTWDAWGNRVWPAKYLVDADGQVRYTHFGEGNHEETEAAVRTLLAESGNGDPGPGAPAVTGRSTSRLTTPETYLGSRRAMGFAQPPTDGTRAYRYAGALPQSGFALNGRWTVDEERATAAADGVVRAKVVAKDVYLVLGPPEARDGLVTVELDGRPIAQAQAGEDVRDGRVAVAGQRLYHLVSLDTAREHELTLRLRDRTSAYAFTFG